MSVVERDAVGGRLKVMLLVDIKCLIGYDTHSNPTQSMHIYAYMPTIPITNVALSHWYTADPVRPDCNGIVLNCN